MMTDTRLLLDKVHEERSKPERCSRDCPAFRLSASNYGKSMKATPHFWFYRHSDTKQRASIKTPRHVAANATISDLASASFYVLQLQA